MNRLFTTMLLFLTSITTAFGQEWDDAYEKQLIYSQIKEKGVGLTKLGQMV